VLTSLLSSLGWVPEIADYVKVLRFCNTYKKVAAMAMKRVAESDGRGEGIDLSTKQTLTSVLFLFSECASSILDNAS
jgi:hypothetical protein